MAFLGRLSLTALPRLVSARQTMLHWSIPAPQHLLRSRAPSPTVVPTRGFRIQVYPQPRRFNNRKPSWPSRNMWKVLGIGGAGMTVYYVTHLEEAPISGRRRFMAVSDREMEAIAKQSYQEIMNQYGGQLLPSNHRYTVFVRRVAQRIIQAGGMGDMKWEYHVISSPEKNAFVLPGGKIFVFTGLLPIVHDEDGLATVLGHEIAHQLAGHHAEKMSYAKFLQFFQFLVSFFVDPSLVSFNRLFLELGILLPNSRKCETEADEIGLQLMAQACFNPEAAIGLWERMSKDESSINMVYLSTHPNSKGRIENIRTWLPSAQQKRQDSDCQQEAYYLTQMFPNYRIRW